MFFGLIPLLLIGFIKEGDPRNFHWTPLAIISLLYLAFVGSSVAFILYYWLVRHMEVTNTMLISLVTPVLAVLLGMGTIGERLSWRMGVGGGSILAGLAMRNDGNCAPTKRAVHELKTQEYATTSAPLHER